MTKKATPKGHFLEGRELPAISSAPEALTAFRMQMEKANEATMTLAAHIQAAWPGGDIDPTNPVSDYLEKIRCAASATPPDMEAILGKIMPMLLDDLERLAINVEPTKGNLSADTTAGFLLGFIKGLRDLFAAMLSAHRYEITLMAVIELQESFNTFRSLPLIQASPLTADFLARLADDLGQSHDPREILASVGISTSAQHAAGVRHSPARELKRRVLEEYERLKNTNPRISKNDAATRIAPLAVAWNTELRAGLGTMANNEKAQTQIRRWLSPSAKGDAMP